MQRFSDLVRRETARSAKELSVAIGLGFILGAIVLFARGLPPTWAGLLIAAALAPTIALFVNDIDKILLIIFVVDIPLGLDIALANRLSQEGGASGLLVSLMTLALVVGYSRWLIDEPNAREPSIYIQKDITIPVLFYLFFLLLSSFQATEVWFSLTQLFLEIQFFLMYFYVINHVRTWADVRLIFNVLAICLFLEGMIMIAQFYLGFEPPILGTQAKAIDGDVADGTSRIGGTFGVTGVNSAAVFLAASLAIIFAAFLAGSVFINTRLALIAILPGLIGLVLTGSRAGWIGITIALLLIFSKAIFRRVGIRAVTLFSLTVIILVAVFSPIILDRLTVTEDEHSAESRLWYSELALNFIREDMFTGAGANNQQFVVNDRDYIPTELLGKERTLIHNKYLAVWVEFGFFGLLAFLWVLLAGVRRAWVTSNHTKDSFVSIVVTGLLATLSVFIVHMIVATYTDRRMQFIWLVLGLIAATSRLAKEAHGPLETTK